MKIDSVKQNNINFEMALYMPKKSKIAKKLGSNVANEAEKARKSLEILAHDVDIYMTPGFTKSSTRSNLKEEPVFYCDITNVGKNKLFRWFNRWDKKVSTAIDCTNDKIPETLSNKLVQRTENLKERFIKYFHS